MPKKSAVISPDTARDIAACILERIEPMVPEDFYLLGVLFEQEAGAWYLRVFIEGLKTPVLLMDCEQIGRLADPMIEETMAAFKLPDEFSYSVEISSPGLYRQLQTEREFHFYRGREIRVTFPEGKKRELEGTLGQYNAETETLSLLKSPVAGSAVERVEAHEISLKDKNVVVSLNPKSVSSLVESEIGFPQEEKNDD